MVRVRVMGTLLVALVVPAGCSSTPTAEPAPAETISPGSAELTINGQQLPVMHDIACSYDQSLTTIAIGDDTAGSETVVDSGNGLSAKSVTIRNLGGFTGSYMQGIGEAVDVTMVGRSMTIAGSADGFNTDDPSRRTTGAFTIKASC